MNDILLTILGVVLLAGMVVTIFLLRKKPLADQEKMTPLIERLASQSEQLNQLQRQNSELRVELGQTLAQTHQTNQGQYEQTNRIMRDINAQSSKMIAEVT